MFGKIDKYLTSVSKFKKKILIPIFYVHIYCQKLQNPKFKRFAMISGFFNKMNCI